MSTDRAEKSAYVTIWRWLMVLAVLGIAVAALPVPKLFSLALVFGIAFLKAGLVMRDYMHLRSEPLLILAAALVPVLLVVGMTVALVPDIVFGR